MPMDEDRLEGLVLVRLLGRGRPPSEGDLRKQLAPLVTPLLSPNEWRDTLARVLQSSLERGWIDDGPLRLTDAGRSRAAAVLGLQAPPKAAEWRVLKDRYLTACALGMDAGDAKVQSALRQSDRLRGAVLARRHELGADPPPTLRRAVDALVSRELGMDEDKALSLSAIRAHVLAQALGLASGSARRSPDKVFALAAARAAGANQTDAAALRLALLRKWLTADGETAPAESRGRPSGDGERVAEPQGEPPAEIPLLELAETIRRAAGSPDVRCFGERKAFIASVWERVACDPRFEGRDLQWFKEQLVEANRRGLLTLHRADLVAAMDPAEVARSQTRYMNTTFHFIETGDRL